MRIARIFWTLTFLLFFAGVAASELGAKIQILRMPAEWRDRADATLLKSQWAARSIPLFLLSAGCGVAGVVFSIKASHRER